MSRLSLKSEAPLRLAELVERVEWVELEAPAAGLIWARRLFMRSWTCAW